MIEPETIVGMDEQLAISQCVELGIKCRVTGRDGQAYMVTSNFRPLRMKFHVEDNIIVKVTMG